MDSIIRCFHCQTRGDRDAFCRKCERFCHWKRKTRPKPGFSCKTGVDDGARTHDNRNHNPGLYQLSYIHRRSGLTCQPWADRLKEGGVDDGARTHDNRNHNPGLYQLSYIHHRVLHFTTTASDYKNLGTGAPDRNRTCNPRLRRPVLYPVELRALTYRAFSGRGGGIRTRDPLIPNQVRYQAALRPDDRDRNYTDSPFCCQHRLAIFFCPPPGCPLRQDGQPAGEPRLTS